MQFLSSKSRIKNRRAVYIHTLLNLILPISILLLVRAKLPYLAVILVLLAKWRIFALQPRYWIAGLQSNSIDIIVSLSFVVLAYTTSAFPVQLLLTAAFAAWLIVIKPQSEARWVSIQAAIAQIAGVVAIEDFFANRAPQSWPELIAILAIFLVSSSSARHFLSSYDDRYQSVLALVWGLFVTELAWILDHWILFYQRYVSHVALIVLIFGYVSMRLYDRSQNERLSRRELRTLALFSCAILLVVLLFSDWRQIL